MPDPGPRVVHLHPVLEVLVHLVDGRELAGGEVLLAGGGAGVVVVGVPAPDHEDKVPGRDGALVRAQLEGRVVLGVPGPGAGGRAEQLHAGPRAARRLLVTSEHVEAVRVHRVGRVGGVGGHGRGGAPGAGRGGRGGVALVVDGVAAGGGVRAAVAAAHPDPPRQPARHVVGEGVGQAADGAAAHAPAGGLHQPLHAAAGPVPAQQPHLRVRPAPALLAAALLALQPAVIAAPEPGAAPAGGATH